MVSNTVRSHYQQELLLKQLRNLLGSLDESALQEVAHRLKWVSIMGGETLMTQGDPGDSLYMLVSGRLRVYIEEGEVSRVVREISRGEVVGEMSLFTEAPRSATLIAIRDSVLVRLAKEDFNYLLSVNPEVSLALTRQIIQRLQTEHSSGVRDKPVTMAVVPITNGINTAEFAEKLAKHLQHIGPVCVVDSDAYRKMMVQADSGQASDTQLDGSTAVTTALDEIESAHDFVLLVADAKSSDWTQRCIRHADEILLIADADEPPALHPIEVEFLVERPPRAEAAEVLVLLHPTDKFMPRDTAKWLARRPVSDHVHVRPALASDIARLARIQSRTAVGLVLAGGGARGFAHLGILRAMKEHGLEFDHVGGTSIGAVMGVLAASDHKAEFYEGVARNAFAKNPTADFTFFPLISLFKGLKMQALLSRACDEVGGANANIEDLWKGFFCIATNYSRASEVVLRRGSLQKSLLCSISIPGALPPVIVDGDLLCDGGTFNNFPVDVMRAQRGVGTVIGVDLSSSKVRRIEVEAVPSGWTLMRDRLRSRKSRQYWLPSLPVMLINTTILYSVSRQKQAKTLTDIYFNPPLERMGLLDWGAFDQGLQQGYRHGVDVLVGLKSKVADKADQDGTRGSVKIHVHD